MVGEILKFHMNSYTGDPYTQNYEAMPPDLEGCTNKPISPKCVPWCMELRNI